MQDINIGIVGAGHMGENYIKNLKDLNGVNLVGFIEESDGRADYISKKYSIQRFECENSFFSEISASIISCPSNLHYHYAVKSLNSYCHTLVEKPICTKYNQAASLQKIADEIGLVLHVGHIEQFNPVVNLLRDYIKNCKYIELERSSLYSGRCGDVDIIYDLGIHDLDILLSSVESQVSSVNLISNNIFDETIGSDSSVVGIEFENGTCARVICSRTHFNPVRSIMIWNADESYIYADLISRTVDFEDRTVSFKSNNPLLCQIDFFISCILRGDTSNFRLESATKSIQICEDIINAKKSTKINSINNRRG